MTSVPLWPFLVLLAQAQQVREEPKDWKLIKTEHFDVYHPSDGLLPRARQFASWFEEARADLIRQTGIAPPRVRVFLYRSFHDLQQSSFLGFDPLPPLPNRLRSPVLGERRAEASPCCRPNARSRALALAEPLRNRIFIHCQPSDRWNIWFVRHELAHQVQYAHLFAFRLPSWLLPLKTPIIPAWFWEGGADYLAGVFEARKDQFVRDLASERLYDLKELASSDVLSPYDFLAVYYEGSYFWRFLDEKYGPGAARRLFEAYDKGLPFPMSRPLFKATGKTRQELERDFAEHLRKGWEPKMAGRGDPSDRLTDSRAYYRRRAWGGRWSPDGKRLAWVGDRDVWPELYVDGKGLLGGLRGLDGSEVTSPPTWSPDGKRLAIVQSVVNRDLLLVVDLDGGSERIALDFDELYDPAWSPDGKKIAFAALKNGTSDLYLLNLADRRVERLTDDPDGDGAPAWSPDGRLAWIKETDGRTVLHVQGQGAVTRSWALMEYPQWSPDGKRIVVAADVDGVYDAFAVDPAGGAAQRLTKFKGGISHPTYHPDGSLLITYFQGRGLDLYRVQAQPQDEPGFDQNDRQGWYETFKKTEPRGEPAEKTREWGVSYLMFPVSSLSFVAPGGELLVEDMDSENHLALGGAFLSPDTWAALGTVQNTRWRPTVGATALIERRGRLLGKSAQPFMNYPVLPTLSTGAGWVFRERTEIEEDFRDPEFYDSGPSLSFLFSNEQGYHLHDAAWGFALGGSAVFFDEAYGGDRDLREYLSFAESSTELAHDVLLWGRASYLKLVGGRLLSSEILEIESGVRGAKDLEGTEQGVVSLEVRVPIWRDLFWKPLEPLGLGEFLIVKDLRGFAFGQAGYAGTEFRDAWDHDFGAASAGLGLRLDFNWMAWPLFNLRVPTRMEFWWAIVGQEGEDARGAVGVGFNTGF